MPDSQPHPTGHPTDRLVGTSSAIAALRAQIRHLATFDSLGSPVVPTLLLQGETGTGKGLLAHIIHDSGPRAAGPFVEVNCAAIPETMLEAELFGFEAGAFTDAKRAKPGLFEAASRGTLLLDEVDALPLALQGKLLTVLEAKRVRRLGAVTERSVDVKLIAATNAALPAYVAAGRFRADLYHRLVVVVLALPPLRERGEDTLVLARDYLRHYATVHGIRPKRLSATAEAWLQRYTWPGNVRELSHVMERATLLHMGEEVDAETLTQLCQPLMASSVSAEGASGHYEPDRASTLPAEAEQIRQALVQTGGNVARAARLLGVSRDTVRYRMQRYGITRPHPAALPLPEATEPTRLPSPAQAPEASTPEASPFLLHQGEGEKPPAGSAAPPSSPPSRRTGVHTLQGSAVQQGSGEVVAPATDVRAADPAWEQKPVAVLALELTWPDVAGLELLRYDPWTAAAHWEQALLEKVQGFGGVLLQRTASLLTWVFGLPRAVEQLPQRAVHGALAIRQMVAEARTAPPAPCPEVRLAVHLGAVRVDSHAPDPMVRMLAVGDALALPVRLLGQAASGEILVSPEVGRLVEGWVALETRALQLRSGASAPVGGYAVVGVHPGRAPSVPDGGHSRSPFVGRERELAMLDAILAQVTTGQGQVVGILGAPGMGKSRLLAEWRQRLSAQGIAYREGHCLAYGGATSYLPVLDLLRAHCGITEDDRLEALTAKVRLALEYGGLASEVEVLALLHLLGVTVDATWFTGLSPEARRARTFATLQQMFLASSQRQPLVLAFENLHWIDPTSEAFLTLLVESLATASILVLATYRPGYHPPWLDKSYMTQLVLQPLDPNASRQVVRRVLQNTRLTPALEQQLLAKAEGNPFFLEELAHVVQERGGHPPVLSVPDTIHAVLASRLDRLPTPEKRLLQAASVIGKDVAFPLLQALEALPEATVNRGLAHLQAAEFLFPKSFVPTLTYTFKHVLTQEAVYQSVPVSTRRQYHQQIAQALDEHFPVLTKTQPELLAHHYTEAGFTALAIAAWQRAGELAAERSAYVEAIAHFSRGLALLQDLPDTHESVQQELDLQLGLGPALMVTRGFAAPEVADTYARARQLVTQLGESAQLFSVLFGLWRSSHVRAQLPTARAIGEQLLSLASRQRDPALLVEAHGPLGQTLCMQGEPMLAREHLHQVVALYEPHRHGPLAFRFGYDPGIYARAMDGWVLWLLGYPEQALRRSHHALRLAQEESHAFTLSLTLATVAVLQQLRRDGAAALEHVKASLVLSTEHGFPYLSAVGTVLQGWGLAGLGEVAEGIAQMREGLAALRAMGAEVFRPYLLALLAEACGRGGQIAAGLGALEEALLAAENHAERFYEAELHRLHGELLLQKCAAAGFEHTPAEISNGHAADVAAAGRSPLQIEAEACFQRAFDIARRQQAKSLELRAAMSLNRLWQDQGKRPEARQLLREVYGWFTEGFDTADLQEAKALLAELERA